MNVLLIDDHQATRREMASLIEKQRDFKVVGEAGSGREGITRALDLHPDIIVMDVVMPGMNGIEATRKISASDSGIRILALSNHTGHYLVDAVLKAGAMGYVRKDQAYEELVKAIRSIAAGDRYVGRGLDE